MYRQLLRLAFLFSITSIARIECGDGIFEDTMISELKSKYQVGRSYYVHSGGTVERIGRDGLCHWDEIPRRTYRRIIHQPSEIECYDALKVYIASNVLGTISNLILVALYHTSCKRSCDKHGYSYPGFKLSPIVTYVGSELSKIISQCCFARNAGESKFFVNSLCYFNGYSCYSYRKFYD